jgi:hypothetical protein
VRKVTTHDKSQYKIQKHEDLTIDSDTKQEEKIRGQKKKKKKRKRRKKEEEFKG